MEKRPYLVVEFGPDPGREICIKNDSMVIGRDSSSDITIVNERISRRHARIFFQEGRWMIEDLGSTNHTRLDTVKLEPGEKKVLKDKNRIQLASQVTLRFHDPESTLIDESKILTDMLWLDEGRGDVYIHNKALEPKLSRRAFSILKLLYQKSQTPCAIASLEEIAYAGWPDEYGISDTMIDSEIYRLRKRLEEQVPCHDFIRSERGQGKWFVQMGEI
jgi:pSer/pThr/pTyr-binding forkhead associated (FHA) protein